MQREDEEKRREDEKWIKRNSGRFSHPQEHNQTSMWKPKKDTEVIIEALRDWPYIHLEFSEDQLWPA